MAYIWPCTEPLQEGQVGPGWASSRWHPVLPTSLKLFGNMRDPSAPETAASRSRGIQPFGLSDLFPICGIIASDPQEAHRR